MINVGFKLFVFQQEDFLGVLIDVPERARIFHLYEIIAVGVGVGGFFSCKTEVGGNGVHGNCQKLVRVCI